MKINLMRSLLILSLLMFCSLSYAQIFNLGNFEIEKDTIGYSGGLQINSTLIKNTKNIFT